MTTINTTKRQPVITTAVNEMGQLVLTFPTIGEMLIVFPDQLSLPITEQALLHGLKQKLVDAAAMSRDPATGRSATDADKFAAVKEVYDRITSENGEWNAKREGGGNEGGLLLRALVEFYNGAHSAEKLKSKLEGYDDKQKAALRANAKIAAIISRLRAEKADPAIDTDAMLDQLGEDE